MEPMWEWSLPAQIFFWVYVCPVIFNAILFTSARFQFRKYREKPFSPDESRNFIAGIVLGPILWLIILLQTVIGDERPTYALHLIGSALGLGYSLNWLAESRS